MTEKIPQVIAIVHAYPDGRINLKKVVRKHLGIKPNHKLFFDMNREMVISINESKGKEIDIIKNSHIRLPEEALRRLAIVEKTLVALVERENAVAIKQFEIVEKEGEIAKIYDLETNLKITRVTETTPTPEEFLPKLKQQYKGFKLKYDVKEFLKGRRTLEAWKARRILKIPERSDQDLRKDLIRKRLEKQKKDGSWEGSVAITARNLRELADLGMTRDDNEVQRAVRWLLERPESPYNPGMFFAFDELVKEQKDVIEKRRKQKRGPRERFNQRKAFEVNLVKSGDSLIQWPCGPRITWTTALVLEALLKLGYEENERVRRALWMLSLSRWCDNAQQHGLSGMGEIKRREPFSIEEIEKIEEECIQRFRYGGVSGLEEIERADKAHIPFHISRISHEPMEDCDKYYLRMPDVGGGCPIIMTRALSQVKNKKLKRLAEAQLWRIAGWQHSQNASLAGRYSERYFKCPQAVYLQVFARYDHPVSKVCIMRMIPWIINNQNEDGSWGDKSTKNISTLAVVSALKNVVYLTKARSIKEKDAIPSPLSYLASI